MIKNKNKQANTPFPPPQKKKKKKGKKEGKRKRERKGMERGGKETDTVISDLSKVLSTPLLFLNSKPKKKNQWREFSLQDWNILTSTFIKTHIQKKFSYTPSSPLINEEDTCFY